MILFLTIYLLGSLAAYHSYKYLITYDGVDAWDEGWKWLAGILSLLSWFTVALSWGIVFGLKLTDDDN